MKKQKSFLYRFIRFILIAAITAAVFFFTGVSVLKTLYPLDFAEYVEEYSKKNNLDPYFVYAVIECESGFDSNAVSHVGAVGLMQIMPDTFQWIKGRLRDDADFSMAYDPETSIEYGCYFYGYLMKKYNNEATALAAYHAGMGNADKWLKDEEYSSDGKTLHTIPFPTTSNYVKKVLQTKNIYQRLYDRKDA